MRRYRQARTRRETPTVDVTAFLSLLVILIPFLLISAVFSGITILELQTPTEGREVSPASDPLQLQVVVRSGTLVVDYQGRQRPLIVKRTEDGEDWRELAEVAADLKQRFPASTEATLLFEPQVPYDVLVQVMDAVRIRQYRDADELIREPMFPNLALGEVAADKSGGRAK
ncbi:biopolymer transporter ExbD [Motiliproteus coralliicola]|nr:biopolymer transporter ExbD [Motiliproteus coralliicola]